MINQESSRIKRTNKNNTHPRNTNLIKINQQYNNTSHYPAGPGTPWVAATAVGSGRRAAWLPTPRQYGSRRGPVSTVPGPHSLVSFHHQKFGILWKLMSACLLEIVKILRHVVFLTKKKLDRSPQRSLVHNVRLLREMADANPKWSAPNGKCHDVWPPIFHSSGPALNCLVTLGYPNLHRHSRDVAAWSRRFNQNYKWSYTLYVINIKYIVIYNTSIHTYIINMSI